MSATTSTPEPMRKLVIWIILLFMALITLHLLAGCQSTYPAQSKVLKQDTNRYNEKVGR